jgi:tetratricopeptide (TPR) repeat protein
MEPDKAISDLNEAIQLDPKSSSAYVSRACVYLDKKEYDKAISDCTQALRLGPKDAMAYNNRSVRGAKQHSAGSIPALRQSACLWRRCLRPVRLPLCNGIAQPGRCG